MRIAVSLILFVLAARWLILFYVEECERENTLRNSTAPAEADPIPIPSAVFFWLRGCHDKREVSGLRRQIAPDPVYLEARSTRAGLGVNPSALIPLGFTFWQLRGILK